MTIIAGPDLQLALETSPFARLLGLTIESFNPDEGILVMTLPTADRLRRHDAGPQLHGGPIACLIDTAATFVVIGMRGAAVSTVDLRVDYLRPATGALRAVARTRRIGRTLSAADVDVFDAAEVTQQGGESKAIAMGRGTFLATPTSRVEAPA